MVESDKSTNAGEIKAVGIKRGCGGPGSKSQGLGHSLLVADEAGLASIANGTEHLGWSGAVEAMEEGLRGDGVGAAGGH